MGWAWHRHRSLVVVERELWREGWPGGELLGNAIAYVVCFGCSHSYVVNAKHTALSTTVH